MIERQFPSYDSGPSGPTLLQNPDQVFSSNDIFFLERKIFALPCDNAKRQVIPERETKSEINIEKKIITRSS